MSWRKSKSGGILSHLLGIFYPTFLEHFIPPSWNILSHLLGIFCMIQEYFSQTFKILKFLKYDLTEVKKTLSWMFELLLNAPL